MLIEKTLEFNANLFLDYAPVAFFFGGGFVEGAEEDFAGSGHDFVAVVGRQKAATDDFGCGLEAACVFVDGEDRNDDAIFGEVAAFANYDLFDFFERAGIDQNAAGRNGIAAAGAVGCEFKDLAGLHEENFAGDGVELLCERGVAEKLAVLAVERDEIFRADEIEEEFHFLLASVAGNVDRSGAAAFVVDQGLAAEEMIDHAEDGFFVAGNDAGGKDDCVVLLDTEKTVIVDGDAREGGHGLGLRAGSEDGDLGWLEGADVLWADDGAVRDAKAIEGVSDFDVIDHGAADEADFASRGDSNIDDLLDSMDRGSEAGDDDAARGSAEKLFQADDHSAFGGSETGTLDIG